MNGGKKCIATIDIYVFLGRRIGAARSMLILPPLFILASLFFCIALGDSL